MIKNAKVVFSEIGFNMPNVSRKKSFVVYLEISHVEKRKKTEVSLSEDLLTKKEKWPIIICEKFVAVLQNSKYRIFDEEGKETGSVSREEGIPISADADCFVLLKGRTITGYNINGESVGSRELTDEEYQQFHK